MVMSGWRKARNALGLHVCVSASSADNGHYIAADAGDGNPGANSSSVSALLSPRFSPKLHRMIRTPLHISSRTTCAICLEIMKPGHGHALFTAECSHSFHFSCIASNVRHGNLVCPVCRATWKEVPWQAPALQSSDKNGRLGAAHPASRLQRRSSSVSPRRPDTRHGGDQLLRDAEEEQRRLEPVLRMLDESIANFRSAEEREKQLAESEPARFDDDEQLEFGEMIVDGNGSYPSVGGGEEEGAASSRAMQITALAEETEVAFCEERESLTILVHVKAAAARDEEKQLANMLGSSAALLDGQRRAAVDLVAVLDVSGSMAGPKLELLKRAMRLVVRSLGAADRLSVVAFASRARRVMALRRMTEEGRRAALQALDSLACTGGTSIADGLRKGTAILQQRRNRNPVATIMLLSDGQESFTMRSPTPTPTPAPLPTPTPLPLSETNRHGHFQIPVHTFGLGVDHDAGTMHTISEESGGTFSFIQGEGLMQDAFAQCLGGLLSVVALRVEVEVQVMNPATAQLLRLEAGSYQCQTIAAGSHALVNLGDLYAHEERDLLVNIRLPALRTATDGEALVVHARYSDPVSGASLRTAATQVFVRRPSQVSVVNPAPCIEVDRHRNRLQAAHAIVEARSLADAGDLPAAQRSLQAARQRLQSSAALHSGDKLSTALDAELARIQGSMNNRHMYQTCGRAYALSAQSSHLRQRATTRASSRSEEVASDGYRTPSMNTMLLHSCTLAPAPRQASPPVSPRGLPPPSPRRRHILEPRPGSRLARLASFDSVIRP